MTAGLSGPTGLPCPAGDPGAAGAPGPARPRPPILVLGVGNVLFTDEGLGVAAAERIAARSLPGVETLDGGTLGLSLLPEIADRTGLLLLDAVVGGRAAAGEVVVLAGEQVRQARSVLVSAHQIGVGEALAAAELAGCAPDRVAAVGIVPDSLDTGYGLSPAVAGKLDTLVDRALDVLAGWGVPVAADA